MTNQASKPETTTRQRLQQGHPARRPLRFGAGKLAALTCALGLLSAQSLLFASELAVESDIKFAWYSSAWGENTDDGLRLLVHNQTDSGITLQSITFLKEDEDSSVQISPQLDVRAGRYAEWEVEYIDIISDNECIERTMSENWKLVEVSNYTLNPSVRNLIIENTDSFRIYQCVENVMTRWSVAGSDQALSKQEWVLFHFETRPEN